MSSASRKLQSVVADAISAQIGGDVDESALPRDVAIRLTAERLVREALSKGFAGDAEIADVHGFSAGNTAMMVARVHARMSYVVKVDTSPSLVNEAHFLQRMSTDPMLPESTRRAFPRVFAIDDEPPIYGYLMENLEDYSPLHQALHDADPAVPELVCGLWSRVLMPAYRATRRTRLAHDLWEDYFGRAIERLHKASAGGVLPGSAEPIFVVVDGQTETFPDGWLAEIKAARSILDAVGPGFGTWVHGDPNPENVMWAPGEDGPDFRVLDPKDWWTGDYLFDAAKLGHYIVVTSVIESGSAHPLTSRSGAKFTLDEGELAAGREIERRFLADVGAFAEEVGDARWQTRYALAFAANLLSIAGPRAERAGSGTGSQRDLADFAFAYGLVSLHRAIERFSGS